MNWDNLRYFLELVRAGTLMGAARRLGVDYSTLSRRILSLEKQVGNQLFERRTSGYHLTDTGKRLLAHVEAIETSTLAIEKEASGENARLSGHVRIGVTEGFGGTFLAPRLAALTRRHLDLEIDLLAMMPQVVNLSEYEADISVTLDRPLHGRYVVTKLTDYTLRLYASPAYLQKHPAIRTRDDLSEHTFIGYVDELVFSAKLRYLEDVCTAPRVALRSTSIAAQLHAAAAGEGLAILPPFMAREYPKLHLVLGGEVKITRSFWMCTHAERKDLARVRVGHHRQPRHPLARWPSATCVFRQPEARPQQGRPGFRDGAMPLRICLAHSCGRVAVVFMGSATGAAYRRGTLAHRR